MEASSWVVQNSQSITCLFAGGEEEATAAYQAAVTACFSDDSDGKGHRHMQVHTSRKTGKPKWTMLEMWPLLVGFM